MRNKVLGIRTILLSVAVMGLVGALMGSGIMAYFSDTEVSSGNVFTAGTIDISIYGAGDEPENPWYSGPYVFNSLENVLPSEPCDVFYEGPGCEMPSMTGILVINEGTNAAQVWKRLTVESRTRTFPGWWRRDGVFLLTVVAAAGLAEPPTELPGSADLATADPIHSWLAHPLVD